MLLVEHVISEVLVTKWHEIDTFTISKDTEVLELLRHAWVIPNSTEAA
jgi:hypothetical protein